MEDRGAPSSRKPLGETRNSNNLHQFRRQPANPSSSNESYATPSTNLLGQTQSVYPVPFPLQSNHSSFPPLHVPPAGLPIPNFQASVDFTAAPQHYNSLDYTIPSDALGGHNDLIESFSSRKFIPPDTPYSCNFQAVAYHSSTSFSSPDNYRPIPNQGHYHQAGLVSQKRDENVVPYKRTLDVEAASPIKYRRGYQGEALPIMNSAGAYSSPAHYRHDAHVTGISNIPSLQRQWSKAPNRDHLSYHHGRPERLLVPAVRGQADTNEGKFDLLGITHNDFFNNAQNLVINHPTIVGQLTQFQRDYSDQVLLWLEKHTMQGVDFNSSKRDPPPRCLPGTRVSILQTVSSWFYRPHPKESVLWVRGAAGVGKSAITQTLVEDLVKGKRLCGRIFFSGENDSGSAQQVFPTIAYQLAVEDLSYKEYVSRLMLEDPLSLDRSLEEQFRILILEPFIKRRLRDGLNELVIVLDGLDKCGAKKGQEDGRFRERSSEDVQCEIIRLIMDLASRYPSAPLIWVIASRPEAYLQNVFYAQDIRRRFWETDVLIDLDESRKDVESFLKSEFLRIRRKYSDYIPRSSIWPSVKDFSAITKAALGLFIFAEVVIRCVDDPHVKNPIKQLKLAMLSINKMPYPSKDKNPLAILDAIYIEAVSEVPGYVIEPARDILAWLAFFDHRDANEETPDLALICNLLGITKDDAITALRHLYSVIRLPGVGDIDSSRPAFYHASFRDYLEDQSRSQHFSIEKHDTAEKLHRSLFRFAQAKSLFEHGLGWPGSYTCERLEEHVNIFRTALLQSPPEPVYFTRPSYNNSKKLLRSVFVDCDFAKLVKDTFWHIDRLITSPESITKILEPKGIVSYATLDELCIDRDMIIDCKIQPQYGSGSSMFLVCLDDPEEDKYSEDLKLRQVRDALCDWVDEQGRRQVRVWGREQFERCLVFAGADIPGCPQTYGTDAEQNKPQFYNIAFVGF